MKNKFFSIVTGTLATSMILTGCGVQDVVRIANEISSEESGEATSEASIVSEGEEPENNNSSNAATIGNDGINITGGSTGAAADDSESGSTESTNSLQHESSDSPFITEVKNYFEGSESVSLMDEDFCVLYDSKYYGADTYWGSIVATLGYPEYYEDNNNGYISSDNGYRWELRYPEAGISTPYDFRVVLVSPSMEKEGADTYIDFIGLDQTPTYRFVKVGDSIDDVKEAYGMPTDVELYGTADNLANIIYENEKGKLEFVVDESNIIQYITIDYAFDGSDDVTAADPLTGLVSEDILGMYRAEKNVSDADSVHAEATDLGYWVQKSIGKDNFPEDIVEMGTHIGNAYEFCFGTDVANNFDNNVSNIYGVYYTLKDYYNSDGVNNKDYYDGLVEDNEYLGNDDPARIDEMYMDLQEFITACNNYIREK